MTRTPSTMLELGTPAPAFALPEPLTGRSVESEEFTGRPLLVIFMCNHCPFVLHILDALAAFAHEMQARGLGVVAINSNDVAHYPDDSPKKMAVLARERGLDFPYLFDESQAVAKAYQAACTPDFYLFDAAGRLAYRGQFDGARPGNGEPVSGADLRAAAEALLSGEAPAAAQKPSVGCNIKWREGNAPAYAA